MPISPVPSVSRREVLANLARSLVSGRLAPTDVAAAKTWIDDTLPEDIAVVVDGLISEGIELESLKPAISRFLNLLSLPLSRTTFTPDDVFFESLMLENKAIKACMAALRTPVAALNRRQLPGMEESVHSRDDSIRMLRLLLAPLSAIDTHFLKKENILFPYFESRFPRYRCLSLMWSIHDDVRRRIKALPILLDRTEPDLAVFNAECGRLFFDVHALIFREECILFPIAAPLLTKAEKTDLYTESRNLGFCLLDRETIARLDSRASAEKPDSARAARDGHAGRIELDSGSLPPAIVDSILKNLPIDLTFIDAEDKVCYFSNGAQRIFPRSPAIIGRDVRNCHPAESVDRVMRIIDAFRRGERDSEEFWLTMKGRFIRIEYTAIRGSSGEYAGTLEASQDLTEARGLADEKRLASF